MPLNLTKNVLFNKSNLNVDIQKSLNKTFHAFLSFFEIQQEDLLNNSVSLKIANKEYSRTRIALISKNIFENLININLSEDFINDLFTLNQSESEIILIEKAKEIHQKYKLSFVYCSNFSNIYNQIFSVCLLFLHFDKTIHLPFNFKIPYGKKEINSLQKRVDFLQDFYPEMLGACRKIDSKNGDDEDSKLFLVSNKEKLVSYGSKLIISLGWIDFSDVNINDLLEFRKNSFRTDSPIKPPYVSLIILLSLKFPEKFKINEKMWKDASKFDLSVQKSKNITSNLIKNINESNKSFSIEDEGISFKLFDVESLGHLSNELKDIKDTINLWQNIELSYIKKLRRENISSIKQSLKYFNTYLFLILYSWCKKNNQKMYPKTPSELKGSLFISKILENSKNSPPTLMEFLEHRQTSGQISKEYLYAILKNISGFFDFISLYSEDLEGCTGFANPINEFDYPKLTRSLGTNKGLIPRNIFGLLISYIEMIKNYNQIIFERIISEDITYSDIENAYLYNSDSFIDTIKLQNIVGFVPLLYWNNKMVIFKEIQNLLDFRNLKIKEKTAMRIPFTHILNHVYVALQTGIRGNHIQWLNAENFNHYDTDKKSLFSKLYVNTDKSKTSGWSPIVHRKVLQTLEEQLKWRELVDNPKFHEEKYYNNNSQTKWNKFYPLFSYETDGTPYSDYAYKNCWLNILTHFQNITEYFNIKRIELAKLLPVNIKINDFDIQHKLSEYGSKCEHKCDLRWTTDITPHSARVSVVSHYITALPAEFIGKYITGQTEAVVHYYAKLDPNYIADLEKGQKEGLAKIAYQKEYEKLNGTSPQKPILTDKENSNLMQSLKIDKKETIVQYGCISINMKEEGKTGIDILLENSNIKLAFNKTEICPYNNNCPADIIKELKGLRKCGICPFAIRTIDHLPAIAVKKRQVMETLEEIELKLENIKDESIEELNRMEDVRQEITEELLGWIMSEEMLEANRKSLESKETYIVKRPEILIDRLQQVKVKEGDVEYLLTRINDNESFPQLDSPLIKAKIDLLRRSLLAKLGNFKESFDSRIPSNPAFECLGLLREVIKRYDLTKENVVDLLSQDQLSLTQQNPLLGISYDRN